MTDIYKIDSQGRIVTSQGDFAITLSGDSGSDQIVNNNETIEFLGGAGLNSILSAVNTITFNHAWDYEQVLSSSGAFDVTLSSISKWDVSVKTIVVELTIRGTVSATSDVMYCFFNNDTTVTNYRRQAFGALAGATTVGTSNDAAITAAFPANTSPANSFGMYTIHIINPNSTNYIKTAKNLGTGWLDAGNNVRVDDGGIIWNNTSAITRIQFRTDNHPTDLFATNSTLRIRFIK